MSAARQRTPAPGILYRDDDLVVVDKPPGLLAAPGRGRAVTVMDVLRRVALAPQDSLRIVHRLDKDASGVLVYARTLRAQRGLVAQFSRRAVEKRYLALVSGFVEQDGEVDLPIAYSRRQQRVVATRRRGRAALTHYRVLERVAGHTLLEVRPVTGRTHQIRVHMASIGYALSVDPLYGGADALYLSHYKPGYRPNRRRPERPLIERLTLHAASIGFQHPVSGAPVCCEAPWPKDLAATVKQLARLV